MDTIKTGSSKLSVDFHTGQVTAVCMHKSYVLAGIGGNIQVFDVSKSEAIYSLYIFSCRNIHGIKKESQSDVFCIWGEKCFRVFKFLSQDCTVRLELLSDVIQVEDWIWDVQWLIESDNTGSLALALGHNVVLHWDLNTQTESQRVECVEKCILYSAHFIGNQWSCLILAAGTVFNQVVFWVMCGQTTAEGKREVIHRLMGHDGVIFSIDYHPQRCLVSSVSDDRSIRLWQVKFPSDPVVPSLEDWQSITSSPIATLYGHSARVWDIRLLQDHFVSIGEDATCCVWDYQWQITQKFKGHKGKSIWSIATSDDGQFVVTGGGDGSVRLWKVDSKSAQTSLPVSCLLIPEHIKANTDDYPRIVTLLNFNTILIMTMNGMLCSYKIDEKTWNQVFQDEDFRSYSILEVCPNRTAIAFGSITGTLKILTQMTDAGSDLMTSYHDKIFTGKVFGLCWLDDYHLLITGPDGVMLLMKLHQSADSSLHLEVMTSLFLPHCKQRWASAALAMWTDSVLVCGDKGGTVHCYCLKHNEQITSKSPVCSFPKIHGKAGVTDVCRQGNCVLTAGRDGHYRTWKVMAGKLELLNSNKVMKGMEWIDRLELTEDDTLVYGFHSAYFTVWSVKKNEKLMEVECGGGHRSWDCLINSTLARFIYLKSREIMLFEKCLGSSQVILKPAFHGRELCDIKYITTQKDATGVPIYLMATCSEDTSINIVSISYTNSIPELNVHHTLQGHLSSVRALSLSTTSRCRNTSKTCLTEHSGNPDNQVNGEKIMFSAGGRAQIQVWRLHFWTNLLHSHSALGSEECDSKDKEQQGSCTACSSLQGDGTNSSLSEFSYCHVHVDTHNRTRTTSDKDDDFTSSNIEENFDRTTSLSDRTSPTVCLEQECDDKISDHTHDTTSQCDDINDSASAKLEGLCQHGETHVKAVDTCGCSYEHLANCFLGDQRHGKGYKPWKAMFPKADPETRILDLTSFSAADMHNDNQQGLHFVAAACSDGFVRLFGFNESSRSFSLLQQSNYHVNCVLKLHHFPVHYGDQSKMLLLSASTDGNIAIWDVSSSCDDFIYRTNMQLHIEEDIVGDCPVADSNGGTGSHFETPPKLTRYPNWSVQISVDAKCSDSVTADFVPVHVLKNHQSGVNSLHVRHLKNNQYMICSGGDDNCLSVCVVMVSLDTDQSVTVTTIDRCQKLNAHAAQITGTWIVSDDHLVTASIDQRVCVWKLTRGSDHALEMDLISTRYVHVSDISNMDVWQDGDRVKIAVCGEGLSMLTIDNVENNTSAS